MPSFALFTMSLHMPTRYRLPTPRNLWKLYACPSFKICHSNGWQA